MGNWANSGVLLIYQKFNVRSRDFPFLPKWNWWQDFTGSVTELSLHYSCGTKFKTNKHLMNSKKRDVKIWSQSTFSDNCITLAKHRTFSWASVDRTVFILAFPGHSGFLLFGNYKMYVCNPTKVTFAVVLGWGWNLDGHLTVTRFHLISKSFSRISLLVPQRLSAAHAICANMLKEIKAKSKKRDTSEPAAPWHLLW